MLVYAAGVCYVLGLLIINQVALRVMLLFGTFFYILYYWFVAQTPLWDAIYISSLIGAANLSGLLALVARKSRLALPRAHRDIYDHFPGLPPGDFRTLMHYAKRYTIDEPTRLTIEGAPMARLFYTLSGEITITKKNDLFKMPSGVFIGEVAFLTHQHASATTIMSAGSELIEWSAADLRRASEKSSQFKMALEATLSLDMARKVAYSVAPDEVKRRPNLTQIASGSSSFSNP